MSPATVLSIDVIFSSSIHHSGSALPIERHTIRSLVIANTCLALTCISLKAISRKARIFLVCLFSLVRTKGVAHCLVNCFARATEFLLSLLMAIYMSTSLLRRKVFLDATICLWSSCGCALASARQPVYS